MTHKTIILVRYSLFIALTAVCTLVIQIPIPATQGYINVGDTMILLSALLLGRRGGAVCGGIGSAIADVIGGYAIWAPLTLIIKGLEGFICGFLLESSPLRQYKSACFIISVSWMIAGYFIAGSVLYGISAASAELPANLIQGGASVALAWAMSYAVEKTIGRSSFDKAGPD